LFYFHAFHIVNERPWPLINRINLFNLIRNLIFFYKFNLKFYYYSFGFCFIFLRVCCFIWWRDIIRERTYQGHHTSHILKFLKLRIILFITREIIFFFRFFWRFFNSCLSPDTEIGQIWPAFNINLFNPYLIPLLNTLILLSSGISITWSHHALLNNKLDEYFYRLLITLILGISFTYFQAIEYYYGEFSLNDRTLGSIFFITTRFHGIHVIIGTIFIRINLYRIMFKHYSNKHHFNFEARAWYWHFVDVVWLFLFIFIYWWFF